MPFKLITCNSVFTLLQSKSGRPASTYVPIKTKFKNYDAMPLMRHALEIYSRDRKSCVARFVRVANNECESGWTLFWHQLNDKTRRAEFHLRVLIWKFPRRDKMNRTWPRSKSRSLWGNLPRQVNEPLKLESRDQEKQKGLHLHGWQNCVFINTSWHFNFSEINANLHGE